MCHMSDSLLHKDQIIGHLLAAQDICCQNIFSAQSIVSEAAILENESNFKVDSFSRCRAEHDERLARDIQSKLTDAEREEARRKRLHDEVCWYYYLSYVVSAFLK